MREVFINFPVDTAVDSICRKWAVDKQLGSKSMKIIFFITRTILILQWRS